MKTLEQIKDEVAKEHDYNSYNDMIDHFEIPEFMVDKVANRYAREVAQASLEKAAEEAVLKSVYPNETTSKWELPTGEIVELDKASITSETNITLL